MRKLISIDADSFKLAIAVFYDSNLQDTYIIQSDKKQKSDDRAFVLFAGFSKFLEDERPDMVCIEKAVYNGSFPATTTITEMVGFCKLACHQFNIPYELIHITHWKKLTAGKGNAKKSEIMEFASKKWSKIIDNVTQDQADAACIGLAYLIGEKK